MTLQYAHSIDCPCLSVLCVSFDALTGETAPAKGARRWGGLRPNKWIRISRKRLTEQVCSTHSVHMAVVAVLVRSMVLVPVLIVAAVLIVDVAMLVLASRRVRMLMGMLRRLVLF